ncbi:hypothetical protein [Reyranella sp. CPCC 100927]|uniref:hypothetical protein n=1 Tax=Reyranella sp. CPCC 100927 TaxID=2599616 RepID=UPI0011B585DB|nr:hypothetical protein [Reyranella sp. CPCC 100927]TWS98449.1 hypothetical protein FQU96_35650 [Reyranella sp. CPCC 100927]
MIDIEQPAMALNGHGAPGRVRMWNTWDVKEGAPSEHIVGWVAQVARTAPGGKLKNIVINCHGEPGVLLIGQGFGGGTGALFSKWRGLVDNIWITACEAAKIDERTSSVGGISVTWYRDGNIFCSEMAKQAGCFVIVSTELQAGPKGDRLPYGKIDSYEGLTLKYDPTGKICWQRRYPSTYYKPPRLGGLIPGGWAGNDKDGL